MSWRAKDLVRKETGWRMAFGLGVGDRGMVIKFDCYDGGEFSRMVMP